MSCWVDMAESFLGNGETIRKEAVRFLQILAELTGKPSSDLEEVFNDYFHNTDLDFLYSFSVNSSAITFLDDINKHGAAIFIANALGDSLFTPNQFPEFYNALTGPKHLEFAPGDHAGPELPGVFGLPNQVWERAGQWNDYYLLNNHNDVDIDMPAVVFNTMNGDEIESYSSWEEVTSSYLSFQFGKDESMQLIDGDSVAQRGRDVVLSSILAGKTANISGGIAYISSTIQAYEDVQKAFPLDTIIRKRGSVFVSEPLTSAYRFRGEPELELLFTPHDSDGTLVVYLLGVDENNVGHLFTFSPWTYKGLRARQETTLTIELTMTAYDIPAGYRLGVVIGTHDTLYLDQNRFDADIDFMEGSILKMPINTM